MACLHRLVSTTGSFGSEAIVLLWMPHVCTLPLSVYPTFYFSTLLCVYIYVCVCSLSLNRQYPCVYCCYAPLYPWQTSIASTSAETSTPPSSDRWRNHNGQLLDNVIHWCSIHKSNIGKGPSHSVMQLWTLDHDKKKTRHDVCSSLRISAFHNTYKNMGDIM